MVLKAMTEEGQEIHVSMPSWFAWLSGILASLIVITIAGTAAKLVDIDKRVVTIESSRFTQEDSREFVQRREYDAQMISVQQQLARIEQGIDRLQEAHFSDAR